MNRIVNQETLVPIGLAVLVIGTLSNWWVRYQTKVDYHDQQLSVMSNTDDQILKLVNEINGRLSRIEWKLETKGDKNGKSGN